MSTAACAHYFAAAFLFARKLPTNDLRVEVEVEKTREPSPRLLHPPELELTLAKPELSAATPAA